MTSLVKVNLTEYQVALLRSEIEDSKIFISKFKRSHYEVTQLVPHGSVYPLKRLKYMM